MKRVLLATVAALLVLASGCYMSPHMMPHMPPQMPHMMPHMMPQSYGTGCSSPHGMAPSVLSCPQGSYPACVPYAPTPVPPPL